MPVYEVRNPATGQTLRMRGDNPPTKEDIDRAFRAGESPNRDVVRQFAQGATFGFSDEATAMIVAAAAKALNSGDTRPFNEIYQEVVKSERAGMEQFAEDHPGKAFLAEAAGGVATGGLVGAKLIGKAAQHAEKVPKWVSALIVGGAEGGLYGAGTAEEGGRQTGAVGGAITGAAIAPAFGGLVNVATALLGDAGRFAVKRLSETPANEARRVIRAAAESAGLNADDIVRKYERLGPEGLLLDTDENFRGLMRAMTDQFGAAKREARDILEDRQFGQIDRIVRELEDSTGMSADDFLGEMRNIAERRAASAGPLYQSAFQVEPSEAMIDMAATRPSLMPLLETALKSAQDAGEDVTEFTMKHFHLAKMKIDDAIEKNMREGNRSRARDLMTLKNDLLAEMDDVAPDYGAARNLYAGDSSMLDAGELGRKFHSYSPDDIAELTRGMGNSEKEMFKLGAVKSIVDRLENIPETYDAARRLINTKSIRKKLGHLFSSDDAAARFVHRVAREREFTRSRGVVTGGSQTSTNLATQEGLSEMTSGVRSVLGGDAISLGTDILARVVGDKKMTPEATKRAVGMMMDKNMTPAQIRQIFRQVSADVEPSWVEDAIYAGAVPVVEASNIGEEI